MSLADSLKSSAIVIIALVALGCNKNHDDARANANSVTEAAAVTEFTTLDANSWVNGSPISLADARDKQVILIEAWHFT